MSWHRLKKWQIAVGLLTLFVVLFLVVNVLAHILIPTTRQSLTVLAIEPVPSLVDGITGPAIHNGDPVITTSHKCNRSDKTLTSHSVKTWQSVDPMGVNAARDNGLQYYKPGCFDFRYSNPMPSEAKTFNETLFSQGAKAVLWRVTAVEFPRGDNEESVAWTSEVFAVIP